MGYYDGVQMAKNYDAWTNQVGLNSEKADKKFKVVGDTLTNEAYNKDLDAISQGYIKMYDTDHDNKISLDEFIKQETSSMESTGVKPQTEQEKSAYKKAIQDLKNYFNKFNVNNDGDSKDVLDATEIKNMFFTMDAFNDDFMADGYITQDEFSETSRAASLDEDNETGKKFATLIRNNYYMLNPEKQK